MHGFGPEAADKTANTDDRIFRLLAHWKIFSTEKRTEKAASVTITRKIDSTTDSVVRRPTLSALRDT